MSMSFSRKLNRQFASILHGSRVSLKRKQKDEFVFQSFNVVVPKTQRQPCIIA